MSDKSQWRGIFGPEEARGASARAPAHTLKALGLRASQAVKSGTAGDGQRDGLLTANDRRRLTYCCPTRRRKAAGGLEHKIDRRRPGENHIAGGKRHVQSRGRRAELQDFLRAQGPVI